MGTGSKICSKVYTFLVFTFGIYLKFFFVIPNYKIYRMKTFNVSVATNSY